MRKKEYSEIYLIISPSGKRYVGQTQCISSKGKIYGTGERWKCHIRDSKSAKGGRCRLLNEEIRKYDAENFQVIPLLTCKSIDADDFERRNIIEYESLNNQGQNENGLNIRMGGNSGDRLPGDTRKRMSISRSNYAKNNPDKVKHTEKTKKQISESLIDNVQRYDHKGNILPKYVKFVNWKDRQGYQIVSHPKMKSKYFVSGKENLDILYQKCVDFLSSLDKDV